MAPGMRVCSPCTSADLPALTALVRYLALQAVLVSHVALQGIRVFCLRRQAMAIRSHACVTQKSELGRVQPELAVGGVDTEILVEHAVRILRGQLVILESGINRI